MSQNNDQSTQKKSQKSNKKSYFPAGAGNRPHIKQVGASPSGGSSTQKQVPTKAIADQMVEKLTRSLNVAFQEIPILRLRPNPFQPREDFDQEEIDGLAQSIRRHGFITVLLVRPDPKEEGYFQLAYGERRWRAAQKVEELNGLPCIIADYSDEQMEDMAILENLQRKDLNPIEEAQGLKKMLDRVNPETGRKFSIRTLADYLGVKKNRVEEPLKLVDIPSDVQEMVRKRPDTVRSAYEIAKLPQASQRSQLIALVLEKETTTREIIYMVERLLQEASTMPSELQSDSDQKEEVSGRPDTIALDILSEPLSAPQQDSSVLDDSVLYPKASGRPDSKKEKKTQSVVSVEEATKEIDVARLRQERQLSTDIKTTVVAYWRMLAFSRL